MAIRVVTRVEMDLFSIKKRVLAGPTPLNEQAS